MSVQGPVIVVSTVKQPAFVALLDDAKMFPVIDATWADAPQAVAKLQPAAVLVALPEEAQPGFEDLAQQIAALQPYVPLIAINAKTSLPENALSFLHAENTPDRLAARLRAALRVRTLHSTVLRRMDAPATVPPSFCGTDPVRDATVLLIGRGANYPALSVSLGERMGVVGALSIEAAAKHLNARDIDGIVLGEGFTARVVEAFLTVLSEDPRFRNLPVVVTSDALGLGFGYDLPNLEIISGEPDRIAINALPLIRQHAFEAYLSRTLRSIDAGGLLDPRTGLLTSSAFHHDLATAIQQTLGRGGGLSVARFTFEPMQARGLHDSARILSRMMRQMDFAAVQEDGSVIAAFPETDLRTAHMIARRVCSVMRHTIHDKRESRFEPAVSFATLQGADTTKSLLERLYNESRRVAS
jgi:hypothetical protein